MENAVGLFDSGLGGLSVLKSMKEILPKENVIYFGDTKNMPYGVKTSEEIKDLTVNAYKKLRNKGIKLFIIACNTATVHGLEAVQEIADIPVVGVIDPGIEAALETKAENILIMATEATINSQVIQNKLKEGNPSINVQGLGCPNMVLAVENNLSKSEEGRKIVYEYLDKSEKNSDAIMLSCTHFPMLEDFIKDYFKEKNQNVKIINPAKNTVLKAKEILEGQNLLNNEGGEVEFYTSSDPDDFKDKIISIIGPDVITRNPEKI